MADSSWTQTSFLGGEWSPFMQGRSDRPDYHQAMNVCRNGFPIEEGAWLRRSGTRFVCATRNGATGRVIPFAFEQNAPYLMEFTPGYLRMLASAPQSGGLVTPLAQDMRLVTTNDNQQVLSISTASPAVVQTSTAHGWSTGDEIEFLFSGAPSNFVPLLRNRVFTITVVDTTHLSLTDSLTGTNIDGSTMGWYGVPLGTVAAARVWTLTTPYTAAELPALRKIQAEDKAIILHGSYAPGLLTVGTAPTSSNFATFNVSSGSALTALQLADGPYLDPPTDGTTLSAASGSGYWTITASAITSINNGAGFLSTDVGRQIRLLIEPPTYVAATAYTVGAQVTYNGTYYYCIQNATGKTPDANPTYWSLQPSAAWWSWGLITIVSSTTVVRVILADDKGFYPSTPVNTWRLGVFSNTTGWPTSGCYYEGRVWLSGAIPNRVDASAVNPFDFSVLLEGVPQGSNHILFSPTAPDGTVTDSNGISYIFNSEDVNPIYWMMGTQTGIICGTQAGEWVIQASALSNPITPTSIQAHRVTKYGCANVEPEYTQLTVSFVQAYQRKILEYFPDVFSGRYTAPNLSQTAKHLTVNGVEEIRFQHELSPIIWGRCGDGSLIGASYKRISLFSTQGPEFIAWHRHDLGSGRTVQSIAVGPSPDGSLDALAIVTTDGSTSYVEVMQPLFDVGVSELDGWFLDGAVVPSGAVINDSPTGNTITFYGLHHLEGKMVTVWCGGCDCGDALVTNASVTVGIDASYTAPFTTHYLQSISSSTAYGVRACPVTGTGSTLYVPAVVGFTYTSQGQLLRPDAIDQARSPTGGGAGKPRRIHQMSAFFAGAQGVSFGTDFSKMHAANFKSKGGTPYTELQLYSGPYWDTLDDTYGFDSMLCWQVNRPYPCAIASVTIFMNTQDR